MGLENIGGWELIVIVLVGLFIFGPDRLPKAISDGVRMLRNLRNMARNATGDLSRELGANIELEDLHPKTFLRKHLLSEADEAVLRRPLDDLASDVRGVGRSFDLDSDDDGRPGAARAANIASAEDAAAVLRQSAPSNANGAPAAAGTNGGAPGTAPAGGASVGGGRPAGYTPKHGYDHDAT